jgi:NAD(P)-dependent dehydrogenase (short-subunit alcohol dehydrogenase family)
MLPLKSLTLEQIRDTFNTNFFSAMELTTVLMKKKINDRQLRSIVFISSIASKFGARGFSAYSASKGALDALMKSLAVELAPEVRANSVLPGGVRTRMTDRIFENTEMVAKFERDYPLGIGEATDIVNAVEFLISEKSRWITGQQMIVDGGRTTSISA